MSVEGRGFVLDTNVLVSALLFRASTPAQALRRARQLGKVLLSGPAVDELADVLSRPKFEPYSSLAIRRAFVAALIEDARMPRMVEHIAACRDPRDDKFLELAVAGGAAALVSGDPDLLVLDPFRGIPILSPALFLERFP